MRSGHRTQSVFLALAAIVSFSAPGVSEAQSTGFQDLSAQDKSIVVHGSRIMGANEVFDMRDQDPAYGQNLDDIAQRLAEVLEGADPDTTRLSKTFHLVGKEDAKVSLWTSEEMTEYVRALSRIQEIMEDGRLQKMLVEDLVEAGTDAEDAAEMAEIIVDFHIDGYGMDIAIVPYIMLENPIQLPDEYIQEAMFAQILNQYMTSLVTDPDPKKISAALGEPEFLGEIIQMQSHELSGVPVTDRIMLSHGMRALGADDVFDELNKNTDGIRSRAGIEARTSLILRDAPREMRQTAEDLRENGRAAAVSGSLTPKEMNSYANHIYLSDRDLESENPADFMVPDLQAAGMGRSLAVAAANEVLMIHVMSPELTASSGDMLRVKLDGHNFDIRLSTLYVSGVEKTRRAKRLLETFAEHIDSTSGR